MAIAELIMPKLGESIMEATILKWHKKVGDRVKLDETVLDIATDKVDSEVPSTAEGIITEILFNVNDVVAIGSVIAKIETVAAQNAPGATVTAPVYVAPQPTPIPQPAPAPVYTAPVAQPVQASAVAESVPYTPQPVTVKPGNNKFFSPLVLNIANSEGISLSELELIPGTGAEERVTKKDVLQYIANKKAGIVPQFIPKPVTPVNQQPQPVASSTPAPVAQPVYVEPTPVYHQPEPVVVTAPAPVAQPVYTEPAPVYHQPEPVAAPAPTPVAQPVYVEPAPVYHQPEPIATPIPASVAQPAYTEPTPVYHHAAPVVTPAPIAQPVYSDPAPVYHQPQPTPAPAPVASAAPVYQAPPVAQPVAAAPKASLSSAPPPTYTSGATEIIEMDRMRKLIANHMVNSKHTSPHVTSFTEADVTNMVTWRDKNKSKYEGLEGGKLTFTPMFIECLVRVMKRFPMINASVDGDKIIIKKDINIGMATALPSGNLIVPVIKGADQLNLLGLTRWVNHLADAGRNNKLKPDDTTGGTFTLTNVGTFGSLMGTPIINQPQVAILAVGAIKKRPVVLETNKGDFIAIRHMMYLSLSYDHRIVDGSIGASFLTEVAKEFEAWDANREIVVESINRIAVI